MTIKVSPSQKSNYHLSLTDGNTTVGLIVTDQMGNANSRAITRTPVDRMALKTTAGNQKFDDFNAPWSPVAQLDWSGGFGNAEFDVDTTRYRDNHNSDPSHVGRIILGGLPTLTTGLSAGNNKMPDSVTFVRVMDACAYLAQKFTVAEDYNAGYVAVLVKRYGTPAADLSIKIYSGASEPTSLLATMVITTTNIADTVSEFYHVTIPGGQPLTDGDVCWIVVSSAGGTSEDCWKIGMEAATGTTLASADGTTWVSADTDMYYRVIAANQTEAANLVTYDGTAVAASQSATGLTASNLSGTNLTLTANQDKGHATNCYTAAITNTNAYVLVNLTPTNGNALNFAAMTFEIGRETNFTAPYKVSYAIGAGTYTDIVSGTIINPPGAAALSSITVNLSTIGLLQNVKTIVHFRLYLTAANGSVYDLDNIVFTGTVYASPRSHHYFQYRGAQYLVQNLGPGNGTTLFINGDRGVADANTGALNTLVDGTKSWEVNEHAGCTVKIISGNGFDEETVYRTIVSNDDKHLNITPDWTIEHDTSTAYVILGSNKWKEIPETNVIDGTDHGHGLTHVTDVCVANGCVWFAQGDSTPLRQMQWRITGGNEEYNFRDNADATASKNYAVYLEYVLKVESSSATPEIWRGQNSDKDGNVSVSVSAVADYGDDLDFGATQLKFRDNWGRINNLHSYNGQCWIGREGSVFLATGSVLDEIKVDEIHTAMDMRNGQAMMIHGAYLYFNLGAGLERYASGVLDDVGPNRDEGIPVTRQGVISDLVGYQGRYFASIDGGEDNYSSIYQNNGTGWNEVYRATMPGLRILKMQYQAIPGTLTDRLYFDQGDDVLWYPMPSQTTDPYNDPNYRYIWEGTLTSGYISVGMVDAYKFFKSLKIFSENLSDNCWIEADYRLDSDTAWTPINGVFDTSPVNELVLLEGYGKRGKRIQYRLRLQTDDYTQTPKVKTTVLDNVSQVTVKYSYSFQFRVADDDVDLNGDPDPLTADDKLLILDGWAENMSPLLMRSVRKVFDGKTVWLNPISLTPDAENTDRYIPRASLLVV